MGGIESREGGIQIKCRIENRIQVFELFILSVKVVRVLLALLLVLGDGQTPKCAEQSVLRLWIVGHGNTLI